MRIAAPAALLTGVLALAPALSSSQSLGEVAAREKARKEREGKAKPVTRVYTEADLRGRVSAGTLSQPVADTRGEPAVADLPVASPVAEGAAPEKTEEELKAERQQEWRDRLQKAQAEVTRLRTRIDQIQTGLNDLTGPLYGGNRAALLAQMDQAQKALAAAQQTVANLEEEGRRSSFR